MTNHPFNAHARSLDLSSRQCGKMALRIGSSHMPETEKPIVLCDAMLNISFLLLLFSVLMALYSSLPPPQPPPYLCLQRVSWIGPPQRQLRDLPPGAASGSASPRNTSESSGPALQGETATVREACLPGTLALCQLGGGHVMKFHSGRLSSQGQGRSRAQERSGLDFRPAVW